MQPLNILLSVLAPQPNVVVCRWFFGYCRHLAAGQLCLRCSARPGGVSDKSEHDSGRGDSRNSIVGVVCRRVRSAGRPVAVRLLWSAGDREYRRSTSSLHRLRAETLQFRQNPLLSSFLVTLRRIYIAVAIL